MVKYLSGRQKIRPSDKLTEDRYQYLGLDQAEPNLADPATSPGVPSGIQYQLVAVTGYEGRRYWVPVGGSLQPGAITIFDEGTPVSSASSITQMNFVGAAVTAQVSLQNPSGHPGIAATVTVIPVNVGDSPPNYPTPNEGELWWESDTGDLYIYYNDGSSAQWVMANAGGRGITGDKGEAGDKGQKGEIGLTGAQGAKGQKGEIGVGQKGEVGDKGQKGEIGVGNKGDKGVPGADGNDGSDGDKGQKGELGTKGDKGDGSAGGASVTISDTAPGSANNGDLWWESDTFDLHVYYQDGSSNQWVSITSNAALKGEKGEVGVTGDKGQKGEVGVTGDKGQKGEIGSTGGTGGTGAKGQKGEVGATGSGGAGGDKGQKGEVGATGSGGSAGDKGQKGEASTVAGDKGQKGEIGATGSGGSTGGTGDKGQKGEVGAQGSGGSAGSDGSDGDKGQKGEQGSGGSGGAKGQKGEVGATGSGGSSGSDGDKGQKGEVGTQGSTGPTLKPASATGGGGLLTTNTSYQNVVNVTITPTQSNSHMMIIATGTVGGEEGNNQNNSGNGTAQITRDTTQLGDAVASSGSGGHNTRFDQVLIDTNNHGGSAVTYRIRLAKGGGNQAHGYLGGVRSSNGSNYSGSARLLVLELLQ